VTLHPFDDGNGRIARAIGDLWLSRAAGSVNAPRNDLALRPNSAFMDACQLVRQKTKMEVVHLNRRQLAAHWNISEAPLERWRSEGIGPKFLKLCGRVLYRQVDIEAYEAACLSTSTQCRGVRASAE